MMADTRPSKRPLQETVNPEAPPCKLPRRCLSKPRLIAKTQQRPAKATPPCTPPTIRKRVSRRCQTVSPAYLRLPRPCNTTHPMPWGVERRPITTPSPLPLESKENQAVTLSREIAELFGCDTKESSLASVFGLCPHADNDDKDDIDGLWNPVPPPQYYEGVEVLHEGGNTRSVATNTIHVGIRQPSQVKQRRITKWRRAARTWRL